jgi:ABC-type transport system involved in Fe-S cluster assembly fused permease/ATPase subunit
MVKSNKGYTNYVSMRLKKIYIIYSIYKMISIFQGQKLEAPITKTEYNLRWSRLNKQKLKDYQCRKVMCKFCDKEINLGSRPLHVKRNTCIKNQERYINELIIINGLFTLSINKMEQIRQFIYNEIKRNSYDLDKFEDNMIDILTKCHEML